MLSSNILYNEKTDLIAEKNKIHVTCPENLLIQVFCGIPDELYIKQIISDLSDVFPGSHLIGTTTAGEIVNGESRDKSTVISLTLFDKSRIRTALIKKNDNLYRTGEVLAENITDADTRLAILFGCGIKDGGAINGEPLLAAFQDVCPHVTVAGGQAGDNGVAKRTFVFTFDGYTDQGVATATLSGDHLNVENRYNLSWVPLGKEMTITGAEGTRIRTIDDRPAKDIYAHYLGDGIADRLPASAAEFPLVVKRGGVMLARHANQVLPDGALDFMAPFKTGEKVQFAFCHSGLLAKSARDMFDAIKPMNCDVFYIYSCLTRKWVLGSDTSVELAPLECLAPTSGFFSYGEYFSGKGENLFLSQTMTIVGLSEVAKAAGKTTACEHLEHEFQEHDTKQIQDMQALHHLIETSARERESLIKELQEALSEIKTLRGFLPICAHCKKIRDDKGYWNRIERYIEAHTEAQFSHSICPDCVKELYSDIGVTAEKIVRRQ